ncbi:MAG TPA: glycine cleavage system aminomethyltransferase GcvT [Thermoanaerobaculia bacterium]|nr:glycine cleavage system aminomethyltransferase GcvT [Thermoanaerobaculia bacterium]
MGSEDLKRTPLYESHAELGARLVPFAGWEMPVQYAGVIDEHRAVRTAAGLFDVSHMGEIRVRGAGAESFLQRLTPNDVSKLAPGRAHYSGLLTEQGTYIDDLLIYRLAPEDFLVVVNASNAPRDFEWIASRAGEETEVIDESDRWALIALQGPKAKEILEPLSPGASEIRYYGFRQGEVDGRPALISRTGYTGEDGFEVYVAPDHAARILRKLVDAGVKPCGLGARDTLRLEAKMALYGNDIDQTTTPLEADLGWIVKLDTGDFAGRDVLAREKAEGTRRKLVGFEMVDRGIARHGYPIVDGGQEIGVVTSGTHSPTLKKAIGLAYLPLDKCAQGTEFMVLIRGKETRARVVPTPFYKRAK